jgi:hypothetical protein
MMTEKKRLCRSVSFIVPVFRHFIKLIVKQHIIILTIRIEIHSISTRSCLILHQMERVDCFKMTKCNIRFQPIAIRVRKKVEVRINRLWKTVYFIFIFVKKWIKKKMIPHHLVLCKSKYFFENKLLFAK